MVLSRQRTLIKIQPYDAISPCTTIYYSCMLWAAPLIFCCGWLFIPLSLDESHLDLALFLVWRALYHQVTTGFAIVVVCIGLPIPSILDQVLVCVFSLLVGLGSDALITLVETDMWRQQLLRFTPVLTGGPIFFGLYLAVRKAFFSEQSLASIPYSSLSPLPLDPSASTSITDSLLLVDGTNSGDANNNNNNNNMNRSKKVITTIEELNTEFLIRFFASCAIILLYLTCVYYGTLMEYLFTTNFLRSASVVLFSVALYPWNYLLSVLAERLDRFSSEENSNTPSFRVLFLWISLLFEHYFVRELFFSLTDYYEVIIVALMNVAKLAVRFPLQMSRRWWEIRRFISVHLLQNPPRPSFERDLEKYRQQEIVTFYFVCMAERISLTTFIVGYAVVHHNYNKIFFEKALPDHEFNKLLGFCGYVLAVEWAGSTIMTLVIRQAYSLNALTRGGYMICFPYFRLCALYATVHICSDYYASIVTTKWHT